MWESVAQYITTFVFYSSMIETRIDQAQLEPDQGQLRQVPLWGNTIRDLRNNVSVFRLVAHNVNGVSRGDYGNSDRQKQVLSGMSVIFQSLPPISATKTNIDWDISRGTTTWKHTQRALWAHSAFSLSSGPGDYHRLYLPGGTCTSVFGKWATRVVDKYKNLGRYSCWGDQKHGQGPTNPHFTSAR
jgi:hypothetical protein